MAKLGETTERLDRAGLSPKRLGESLGETARQVRDAVADPPRDVAGRAKEAIESDAPAPQPGRDPGPGMATAAPGRPNPAA